MSTLAAEALAGLAPNRDVRRTAERTIARLDRYRFLLLLRFVLINLTGFALLAAAWLQGWIAQILAADDTHICKLIFGLFLVGLVWSAQKVWMLSRELNALDSPARAARRARSRTFMTGIAGRSGAYAPGAGRRAAPQARAPDRARSAISPARWCCWA